MEHTSEQRARAGLRERKKARTRAAIQQHALRLFREQGYVATTVEQIAEAAEVSQSTFFRYFPSKEDVVLYDATDPVVIAAFQRQPAELTVMQATRAAMRAAFADERLDLDTEWERQRIILANTDLRSRMLDDFARTLDMFAGLIAERLGRDPDDFEIRAACGAVFGVAMAAWFTCAGDLNRFLRLLDEGLGHLEKGLSL